MSLEELDSKKSLEGLEEDYWGEPPSGSSKLISESYRLRRKALGSLTAEDLRLLVGQNIGNEVLIPIVLRRLKGNPLLEGDYYPGDVLAAVLRVAPTYWSSHAAELREMYEIISNIKAPAEDLSADIENFRNRVR